MDPFQLPNSSFSCRPFTPVGNKRTKRNVTEPSELSAKRTPLSAYTGKFTTNSEGQIMFPNFIATPITPTKALSLPPSMPEQPNTSFPPIQFIQQQIFRSPSKPKQPKQPEIPNTNSFMLQKQMTSHPGFPKQTVITPNNPLIQQPNTPIQPIESLQKKRHFKAGFVPPAPPKIPNTDHFKLKKQTTSDPGFPKQKVIKTPTPLIESMQQTYFLPSSKPPKSKISNIYRFEVNKDKTNRIIRFDEAIRTNSWIPTPENIPSFLKACSDLFLIMKTAHDLGTVFRDIKPENCYINLKNKSVNEINIPVFENDTPGFYTESDSKKFESLKNFDEKQKNLEKRDIFAIATTIWYMISLSLPYPIESLEYPDTTFIHEAEEVERLTGYNITNILIQALSEHPNERPDLLELARIFSNRPNIGY